MKKILSLLLIWGSWASAQTLDDVELFNTLNLHGSARYQAMGGAFTALGNDFSSIHLNPASAAVFRSSQFGASAGVSNLVVNQQGLFGQSTSNNEVNLSLENLGFVNKSNSRNAEGSSGWAFAISYQKLADFERSYRLSGENGPGVSDSNTLGQYYLFFENYGSGLPGALGRNLDDLSDEAYAAYQAGVLVDVDNDDVIDDYAYGLSGRNNNLSYRRQQSGSHNEIGLSLAGEQNDRFYYGLSLNFPTINYSLSENISESALPADTLPFDAQSYNLRRFTNIQAAGINFNLGVIARPNDWLRVAASVQTPSWYTVDEYYEFQMAASFTNGDEFSSEEFTTGNYSYRLNSPAIYRAGAGFLLPAKKGVVSIDYEFRDPSSSRVRRARNDLTISNEFADDANENISSTMASVSTIKGGIEYRLGPVMLRGGLAYSSSMYQQGDDFKSSRMTSSTGVGYQNADFGIDLAVVNHQYSRQDFVHPFLSFSGEDLIANDFSRTNVVLGFHLKF